MQTNDDRKVAPDTIPISPCSSGLPQTSFAVAGWNFTTVILICGFVAELY